MIDHPAYIKRRARGGELGPALRLDQPAYIKRRARGGELGRPLRIDHTGTGVADVARSAVFYDAALGALGMRRVMQLPPDNGSDGIGYGVSHPVFWIDRFHPHGVQQHTAFAAGCRGEVEAFHAAALQAGGTDNGGPGPRDATAGYPPGYHAAFVLDPDGNNMEAVFRERT